jgi:hypothetical protein
VTFHKEEEELMYVYAGVTCNHIASEMEAMLQSLIGKEHPWRTNNVILFDALATYYNSIVCALNRTHLHSRSESDNQSPDQGLKLDLISKHTQILTGTVTLIL